MCLNNRCAPILGARYTIHRILSMSKSTHSHEYDVLRQQLRAMRKAAGLSQRVLARRLMVPPSWVSKVETGERRLDMVEFYWFCLACGENPSAVSKAILEAMGESGAEQ